MNIRNIVKTSAVAVATVVLGASPAFALVIQVPEPSALSIYGGAVAGLVIAARWLRRK